MTDNKFIAPAVAALLLAVLFPAYWATQFFNVATTDGMALYHDLSGLNPSDIVFLVVGILTMYVYWCFKHFLNERHEFSGANIPILLIIIATGVFTFGTLAMDTFMQFFGDELQLPWHYGAIDGNAALLLVTLIIFGLLDIVIGVVLFTKAREFSSLIKIFAVVILIQGICELSIVFGIVSIVSFSVASILLSVIFLRQPDVLEVI